MEGDCTSCEVSEAKSAYWTPGLYFLDSETGEYTLVEQVGGMLDAYMETCVMQVLLPRNRTRLTYHIGPTTRVCRLRSNKARFLQV